MTDRESPRAVTSSPLEEQKMTAANPDGTSATAPTAPRSATPSTARRARLTSHAQPVRPEPSTSAVALGLGETSECATVTLGTPQLRLDIAPSLGGAVTSFGWCGHGGAPPP